MRNYGPDRPCSKCGMKSPETEFKFRSNGSRYSQCRECINTRERTKRQRLKISDPEAYVDMLRRQQISYRKHIASNTEKAADARKTRRLKYRYNLAPEQLSQMYNAQQGLCKICREPIHDPTILKDRNGTHIDHSPTTGKVRALLCETCNMMLGSAKDNPRILLRGAAYLRRHS